jgi:hypothetical protein
MKSYIKLYGPPIYDAIKALEGIALDFPQVCIMDTILDRMLHTLDSSYQQMSAQGTVYNYFHQVGTISVERCDTIVSKSGESLGEYDFYFEWFTTPDSSQLQELIKRIDETLKPTGVNYTITTK